jgi:capsular exopolysaccharide synthesis family protein
MIMRHLPIRTQDRSILPYDNFGADYVHLAAESQVLHKQDGLKAYINILRRRKWYILIPVLLIIPLMALGLYMEELTYKATAQVLVEDTNVNILKFEDVLNPETRSVNFLLTEYQIMQSEDNIAKVVDTLALDEKIEEAPTGLAAKLNNAKRLLREGIKVVKTRATALLSPSSEEPESSGPLAVADGRRQAAITAFKKALVVEPQPGGKLVNISVSGPNPQDVASQANTLAEVYARKNLEKKLAAETSASEWLTEQTADLRQKVYEAELRLQEFREKGDRITFDREEQKSAVFADLQRLYTEYNTAKTAREDVENRLRHLTDLSRGDVSTLQTIPPYLDPHLIQSIMQLRTRYQTLSLERANNAKLYRPKHPVMVRLDLQIGQVKRAIAEEFQKAVKALKAEYDVRLAREQALEQDYNRQKGTSISSRKDDIDYQALQRDVESYRRLFQETSERLREIKLNQASAINNVSITKRAAVPIEPVPSKAAMKMMSGLLLASCLGVGFAFIREYFDNRFKEADEVESFLQIPFLGLVPNYPQGKGRAYEPVSLREPGSVAAEAYRILRTRIQAAAPRMKTLLVTSALPSEGKSTTTANLGIAFARLGLNVLMVDIDLRRPSLHRHFWISNSEGLATALVDGGNWRDYIQDTVISNLKILPTGFNTHNPSDLLSFPSTTELLSQLKDAFDLVIFDSPIVLSIPDVEIIAPWMDNVVLVHYPERCDKPSVLNAKMLVERVASNILGVVFNNIQRPDQKYYYQQRTYYSQNMYSGAEQYDLGESAVRRLEPMNTASEPADAIRDAGDELADLVEDEKDGEPIAFKLGRVIVNETIAGERAGEQMTFLILELELSHASERNSTVVFRPESAIVHLDHANDPDKKVIYSDSVAEKIQNGLVDEVWIAPQETKTGMIVYRIPSGVPKCVLEYGNQRADITVGF